MTTTLEGITEQLRIIAPQTAETWAKLTTYPPTRKAFEAWIETGKVADLNAAKGAVFREDLIGVLGIFGASPLHLFDKLPLAWKRESIGHREPPQMVTALGYPLEGICRRVAAMLPGEKLAVPFEALREIPSYEHKGATFTAPDRVLGNITGAAFTHSFWEEPHTQVVIFERHRDTGKRHYTDPDRRGERT